MSDPTAPAKCMDPSELYGRADNIGDVRSLVMPSYAAAAR
ncbi:hypothetical protein DFR68_104129 [Nocardia mexicana]|uniref:Uncharacterized protein n=1 Tax=Nocardia mexicana TaxID=279262 RepID=A0A370H6R8_9NOCA|nr:hypothetical protein DFR68_104129 [Nocardia mexicana]